MNNAIPLLSPIVGLLQSRKALVMMLLNSVLLYLFISGRLKWEQIQEVLAWVNSVWLGSHALEAGAEKISPAVNRVRTYEYNLVGEVLEPDDENAAPPTPRNSGLTSG